MNKIKVNYFVDVALAISFFIVFVTGILKMKIFSRIVMLPSWVHPLHDWSGILMGIIVFIHLALHWKWIVSVTKSIFKKDKK